MKYLITTVKTLPLLIILLILIGCATKKELVNLERNYQDQEEKLTEQNQQRILLTEKMDSLRANNTALADENDQLKTKLVAARESLTEIAAQEPECPEAMTKGVVFKVQIGAYEERNIAENLTTAVMLDTEEKGDMQKIVIGQFRIYQKADRLKQQLRAMGVEDAWVVPYKNGKRVPLESVISNLDVEN